MVKILGTIRGHRFSTAFHLAALIHHLIVIFYCNFVMDFGQHIHQYQYIRNMARFSMRFFTAWNFVVQAYYFSLCLTHDLLQMTNPQLFNKAKKTIAYLRNYTFRTFAFPLAFTVTLVFWGLFMLNRSFVYPPEAELVMPAWVNHAMHTNIALVMLVEIVTTCHGYDRKDTRRAAIFGITAYTVLYIFCYFGTYIQHGVWLYPIYDILTWTQRMMFLSFTFLLTLGLYLCGEGLSIKLWEGEVEEARQKDRKVQ